MCTGFQREFNSDICIMLFVYFLKFSSILLYVLDIVRMFNAIRKLDRLEIEVKLNYWVISKYNS